MDNPDTPQQALASAPPIVGKAASVLPLESVMATQVVTAEPVAAAADESDAFRANTTHIDAPPPHEPIQGTQAAPAPVSAQISTLFTALKHLKAAQRFFNALSPDLTAAASSVTPTTLTLADVDQRVASEAYESVDAFELDLLNAIDIYRVIHRHGSAACRDAARVRREYAELKLNARLPPPPPPLFAFRADLLPAPATPLASSSGRKRARKPVIHDDFASDQDDNDYGEWTPSAQRDRRSSAATSTASPASTAAAAAAAAAALIPLVPATEAASPAAIQDLATATRLLETTLPINSSISSMTPAEVKAFAIDLFDALINEQGSDGSGGYYALSEVFYELPTEEELPDYYAVIEQPIDLAMVKRRIDGNTYARLQQFDNDINLLLTNALTYNEPSSQIAIDARALSSVYKRRRKNLVARRSRRAARAPSGHDITNANTATAATAATATPNSSSQFHNNSHNGNNALLVTNPLGSAVALSLHSMPLTNPTGGVDSASFGAGSRALGMAPPLTKGISGSASSAPTAPNDVFQHLSGIHLKRLCTTLLDAMVAQTDSDGRVRAELFIRLPTRDELPEYYQIIQQPVDIVDIQRRIQTDAYTSFAQFDADIQLMFQNAFEFNEAGSEVYDDARSLRDGFRRNKRKQLKLLQDSMPSVSTIDGDLSASAVMGAAAATAAAATAAAGTILSSSGRGAGAGGATAAAAAAAAAAAGSTGGGRKPKTTHLKFTRRGGETTHVEQDVFREIDPVERKPMRAGIRLILDALREVKGPADECIFDEMLTPPDPENNVLYYQMAEEPLGFGKILDRLKRSKYMNPGRFIVDCYRVLDNTLSGFAPDTVLHKGAREMKTLFTSLRKEHLSPVALATAIATGGSSAAGSGGGGPADGPLVIGASGTAASSDSGMLDTALACRRAFKTIVCYRDESGRELADMFRHRSANEVGAEKPRSLFVHADSANDFATVEERLQSGHYLDFSMFARDCRAVLTNALHAYSSGTGPHVAATALLTVLQTTCDHLLPRIHTRTLVSQVEPSSFGTPYPANAAASDASMTYSMPVPVRAIGDAILAYLGTLREPREGYRLLDAFNVMPDAEEYPDYYRVISSPMDIRTVQQRLRSGAYQQVGQFESDMMLIFRNATMYNVEGSAIYTDATTLRAAFQAALARQWPLVAHFGPLTTRVSPTHALASSSCGHSSAPPRGKARTLPTHLARAPPLLCTAALSTRLLGSGVTAVQLQQDLLQTLLQWQADTAGSGGHVHFNCVAPRASEIQCDADAAAYYSLWAEPLDLRALQRCIDSGACASLSDFVVLLKRTIAVLEAWNQECARRSERGEHIFSAISRDAATMERLVDERLAILAVRDRLVDLSAGDAPLQRRLRTRFALVRQRAESLCSMASLLLTAPRCVPAFQQSVLDEFGLLPTARGAWSQPLDMMDVQEHLVRCEYTTEEAFDADILRVLRIAAVDRCASSTAFTNGGVGADLGVDALNVGADETRVGRADLMRQLEAYFVEETNNMAQVNLNGERAVHLPGWRSHTIVPATLTVHTAFFQQLEEEGVNALPPLTSLERRNLCEVSVRMERVMDAILSKRLDSGAQLVCQALWTLNGGSSFVGVLSLAEVHCKLRLGHYRNLAAFTRDVCSVIRKAATLFPPASTDYQCVVAVEETLLNALVDVCVGHDAVADALFSAAVHLAGRTANIEEVCIAALLQHVASFRTGDGVRVLETLDGIFGSGNPHVSAGVEHEHTVHGVVEQCRQGAYMSAAAFAADMLAALDHVTSALLRSANVDTPELIDVRLLSLSMPRAAQQLGVVIDSSKNVRSTHSCVSALLHEVLTCRVAESTPEPRVLSAGFLHAPTRLEDPAYHSLVVDAVDLASIRERVQHHQYNNFLEFDRDMNLVFENTRRAFTPDQQLYADSIALQQLYLDARDELVCTNLPVLHSSEMAVQLKREPLQHLMADEETLKHSVGVASVMVSGVTYTPGDFVYVDLGLATGHRIMCLEKILEDQRAGGIRWAVGTYFYRPAEANHQTARSFHGQEVFIGQLFAGHSVALLSGKCLVMHSREYVKMVPVGLASEHVYLCENRFVEQRQILVGIKTLELSVQSRVHLEARPERLVLRRVPVATSCDRLGPRQLPQMSKMLAPQDVRTAAPDSALDEETDIGKCQYFSLIFLNGVPYSVGDTVALVRAGALMRIVAIWTAPSTDKQIQFAGVPMKRPHEIHRPPFAKFYPNEVILVATPSALTVFTVADIARRCAVLGADLLQHRWPADFCARDVFVCERAVDVERGELRPLEADERALGAVGPWDVHLVRQQQPSLKMVPFVGDPLRLRAGGTSGDRVSLVDIVVSSRTDKLARVKRALDLVQESVAADDDFHPRLLSRVSLPPTRTLPTTDAYRAFCAQRQREREHGEGQAAAEASPEEPLPSRNRPAPDQLLAQVASLFH